VIHEGDWISIDGTIGELYSGQLITTAPDLKDPWLIKLLAWADNYRRLGVWTNADYPDDARRAREYGAQGIGLCRTEHMFFETDRLPLIQKMIMADLPIERREALAALLPFQREDFAGLFRVMDGLPVIIRLIDPPLHEFLPQEEADIKELAAIMGISQAALQERTAALHEFNPMLGHRGCRLGIAYPEIYAMQVRAIMEAACEVAKSGLVVIPEIMIPLVADVNELKFLKKRSLAICDAIIADYGVKLDYLIGTMIELPRAALTADVIAEEAEFFSFGTNDLTQTTYGLSRDDAGKFLPAYIEQKIFPRDPFVSIDVEGVGALMEIGVMRGRTTRPELKIGICGEHGGEPASIAFCHRTAFDYVSCSPFRVPIARLAAAHAALQDV
ncbi:MAG: pyruvate, phosphate dikinase, partial [Deltaproteobacteria bacterium]|nr:pyruvate, phosphate dikinase [Deltaproteobacteria bacterium]